MSKNYIKEEGPDRKYFIMTPQLVWVRCENVYQYTLWNVIKMIAAEDGECILSTPDLATAAMMSVGKCSQARERLIELELLKGHICKDPGYPQPVWHLSIPDLWPENIEWRQQFDKLRERIDIKRGYCVLYHKEHSPGERGTTPREKGPSPREKGTTPDETKKNHLDPG